MVGPLFIALSMFFRGTDVLFRRVTLNAFTPLEMITIEHFIACVVLLFFFPDFKKLKTLNAYEIFCLIFVACATSVGGILCFTTAFRYMNPAIVVLLQKLQPIATITLSILLLKEKPRPIFFLWAAIAIIAGYILSFELSLPALSAQSLQLLGVVFAMMAVLFWGSGTVFGKVLLKKLDHFTLTRFRYYFGLIFALSLLLVFRGREPMALWSNLPMLKNLAYMAIVPGLLALHFYYRGLKTTRASLSSILELIFPLSSVVIAWVFLRQTLSPIQMISGAVLLFAVVMITRQNNRAISSDKARP